MATRIEVRAGEDLTPAERAEIVAVCNAANDTDLFHHLFEHIPAGRHALVRDGDVLVAHAVASTRWAQPGGHPVLRTAYLDAVATHPTHQHRGHGSAVVSRLTAELDDYEVACLQTDVAGFYTRLGWELWRGALAGRRDDGTLVPTPDQGGVMILRLPTTPDLDLDASLTIELQPDRIWE